MTIQEEVMDDVCIEEGNVEEAAVLEDDSESLKYFRARVGYCHTCDNERSFKENQKAFLIVVDRWKNSITECVLGACDKGFGSHLYQMLAYEDIKLFVLESLVDLLEKEEERYETFQRNIFDLLSRVPPVKTKISDVRTFFALDQENGLKHILKLKKLKKIYSKVWLTFIKTQLSREVHMNCIKHIPVEVMPNVCEPILFTDFFFKSYDLGAPFNMLALNGLFILIVKHNLDYPEFFKQVYNLLTPDIYDLNNREQFLTLLDTFLSSLHVPSYMVAAFVKRLARLALTAPPDVCLTMVTLIKNWMIRHGNLNFLINNESTDSMANDPFDMVEKDPMMSKAAESSLWELKVIILRNNFKNLV
uniref:CCAAT-binding factor domain-containing protein n=1 Tax=Romanomermis culicivorax TaxID=13658 RepID=A0A915JAN3_ROMCU